MSDTITFESFFPELIFSETEIKHLGNGTKISFNFKKNQSKPVSFLLIHYPMCTKNEFRTYCAFNDTLFLYEDFYGKKDFILEKSYTYLERERNEEIEEKKHFYASRVIPEVRNLDCFFTYGDLKDVCSHALEFIISKNVA